MAARQRRFSSEEKVRILRRHLVEKVAVSDLCDEHHLRPNVFYRWQKELFENGSLAFEHHGSSHARKLEKKVLALETKLARRNEAIAELMEENVAPRNALNRTQGATDAPKADIQSPRCLRKLPLAEGKRVSYSRGAVVQFTLNQYSLERRRIVRDDTGGCSLGR